jgi:hypothetical protein
MIPIQILHEIPVNCHNATFQSWGKQVTTTYICIVLVRLAMQSSLSGIVTLLPIEIGYSLLTAWILRTTCTSVLSYFASLSKHPIR